MERWRTVPGHEAYKVSDLGRVKSFVRYPSGRLLKPKTVKRGHLQLQLGREVYRYVHQLVLEAFVGSCPSGQQCCHKDDNPSNNTLKNLRWDTQANNMKDKIRNGKQPRGEKHARSKLKRRQVKCVKTGLRNGITHAVLAEQFGVSESTISNIKTGRTWSHV